MSEVYQHRVVDGEPITIVHLLREPEAWLEEAVERAGHFGRAVDVRLRSELGLSRLRRSVSKRARFEVGEAQLHRDRFIVPVTWEASGYTGLFPVMDAILEIRHAGRGRSRLVFWGRYDPPLGRAGELVDRYVAHQVAEETVSKLLDALEEKAA